MNRMPTSSNQIQHFLNTDLVALSITNASNPADILHLANIALFHSKIDFVTCHFAIFCVMSDIHFEVRNFLYVVLKQETWMWETGEWISSILHWTTTSLPGMHVHIGAERMLNEQIQKLNSLTSTTRPLSEQHAAWSTKLNTCHVMPIRCEDYAYQGWIKKLKLQLQHDAVRGMWYFIIFLQLEAFIKH